MKKSLVALAVLAASGAAMAQSTVTLYGVADVYLGRTSSTATTGVKTTNTVVNSGGFNGSRWGLRGTEDLGGGLKANFVLESGFTIDNGNVGNGATMFGRQAFVGLSGGFGAVNLGRQYTAYDDLRGATNNIIDAATFAPTGDTWQNGIADYANRVNNAISYTSPTFGGFSGRAVMAFGENKSATNSAADNLSLHIKYANGPLVVGYAHQREETTVGAAPVLNGEDRKYNLLGASYDLGVVKLVGQYNTVKFGDLKDKEWQLGAQVPVSAAASVLVGYARSKGEGDTVDTKGTGYTLAGLYDVSKRTRLYVALKNVKIEGVAGETKANTFGVGVRHAF
jgi:predicted porin